MQLIRGGMGLGDSLMVQAIARHLVKRGERVRVATAWPDVFRPLGDAVQCVPFTRAGVDRLAHYSTRKGVVGTDQFADCCITAGIREPVELVLDWQPSDSELVRRLREISAPIVVVGLPRTPMGRTDGFGAELLPKCEVIQACINGLPDDVVVVQVGSGAPLFKFSGIDIDLANETTVAEMLDVASLASGFLGYCSFLVPLAESLQRPGLFVWSRRGLKSPTLYVRQITPQKILHRPDSSLWVVDDWQQPEVSSVLERFSDALRRS